MATQPRKLWQTKRPNGARLEPIAEAIRARMLEVGSNPHAISVACEIHYATIYKFMTGQGGLRSSQLARILDHLGLAIAVKP